MDNQINDQPNKQASDKQAHESDAPIGTPIPRGTIHADAPLVDEALAARHDNPANPTADTVSALKAEIETLKSRIADRQSEAVSQARNAVRRHPLSSLGAALFVGYSIALLMHHQPAPRRRGWRNT